MITSGFWDTGTGVDVTGGTPGVRTSLREPIRLLTGGGEIHPTIVVQAHLTVLDEDFSPLELKGSPNALTVGRRCAESGYEYSWKPYHRAPTFTKPDGSEVELWVVHVVVWIRSSTSVPKKGVMTFPLVSMEVEDSEGGVPPAADGPIDDSI